MNREWYVRQIEVYNKEYPTYEVYSKTLKAIMKKACSIYAPNSIVQARVKKIWRYAEKIIRKSDKYINPISEITDLCGIRIIVPTLSDIKTISNFIRAYLIIDENNTVDVSTRLKCDEFGYLSMHYVVALPPKQEILGIEIPEEIGSRKAEIQLRTALQHSWADISHKKIYKSPFNIAERFKREAARLAAVVENTDQDFEDLTQSIDYFNTNYSIYMKEKDIETEIDILQTIADYEFINEEKINLIMRLVQYAKILKKWDVIIKNLTPLVSNIDSHNPIIKSQILLELGYSLCHKFRNHSESSEFELGRKYLKRIVSDTFNDSFFISDKEKSIYTNGLIALAWTYRKSKELDLAKELYLKAYSIDSSNPSILLACMEYYSCDDFKHPIMQQSINNAIRTCIKHIRDGIELPKIFFELGRLYFLIEAYDNSISSYLDGLHFCSLKEVPYPLIKDIIDLELEYYEDNINTSIPQHKWIYKLLLLGSAYLSQDNKSFEKLNKLKSEEAQFKNPILIFCDNSNIRNELGEALKSYPGNIISRDSEISLSEVIQDWVNLAAIRINPLDIVLLDVCSSRISLFEYKLALALGATVALVEGSDAAASEMLADKSYSENPRLIPLSNDPIAIKTFINNIREQNKRTS